MTLEEKKARYVQLAHAMQAGVAFTMTHKPGENECTPKHLRVGVNMALCEHSALAHLMMEKGVITEDEYFDKVNELLEKEVKSYEEKLQKYLDNANVKLI